MEGMKGTSKSLVTDVIPPAGIASVQLAGLAKFLTFLLPIVVTAVCASCQFYLTLYEIHSFLSLEACKALQAPGPRELQR